MKRPIYLDYNATTPADPLVLEAMLPFFQEDFGNSVSAAHSYGWSAEKAVERARQQVANFIGCLPAEIVFTAGATESNNWVIRGLLDRLRREDPQQKIEMISSPLEHSSVTRALKYAESQGVVLRWAEVNRQGELNFDQVHSLITPNTKLMSFMWVNNEIGTINPMAELTRMANENEVYLHSDGTQALGKVRVNLSEIPIHLFSFSGHKIYGPKGVGVLVIKSKNPKVQVDPLLHGGGHERGLRSGTLNVPAIVGLGKACELLGLRLDQEIFKLRQLQDLFWTELQKTFPHARLNGPPLGLRAPNNLNVSFLENTLAPFFAEIAISKGSACHSGAASGASPVLSALGVTELEAEKTLRISLGRWTTEAEVLQALDSLKKNIGQNHLR
jgi:cysteine desulfurase